MAFVNDTAFITGVTGQDGAYLAKLLVEKGYRVYGGYRRGSKNLWRLRRFRLDTHPRLTLLEYDHDDPRSAVRLLKTTEASEVYNFGGHSTLAEAATRPQDTAHVVGLGVVHLLSAIQEVDPNIRFFQASSAEMFRGAQVSPQDENTELSPRNVYGVTKAFAHWMTVRYRNDHDLFAVSGILYNHESPLRAARFVTRKITQGLVGVKLGRQDHIEVGNLEAKRDWGYAPEYVDCAHRSLQYSSPETFVIATGRVNTVRTFIDSCCKALEIELCWRGEGLQEVGVDIGSGSEIVRINPKHFRREEGVALVGNAGKAQERLGWKAQTSLEDLCGLMVEAEQAAAVAKPVTQFPE